MSKNQNLQPVKRVFKFNGKELVDPGEHMSPSEVMELYSRQYPSLTKGEIAGPFYEDGEEKYKIEGFQFQGKYGTKG